ncbi:putative phage abortive infection protein [Acinetobacter baumannii]|uniref:putative phage abortive infection protein n=1 Tax=Acinetobacter baumannii TaxID=470 RepID=UPI000F747816|nr:putative phage abortive infection protein [Acinetobacter baumannii]EHU2953659.1 hypothetical protein [Acinetobacter baumannii]RSP94204.1 hypothetical protein EA716_11650 [Acinetobacter baumannii]
MKTPTKNQSQDKIEKIESLMKFSIAIAVSIFVVVFGLYFFKFGDGTLAETKEDWGTFGDFVGGLLNPTIAALALYWLISSVKLQIEELKETNKALSETVETAKKQQNQVSLQNFENLFFQLLKTKTNVTNDIVLYGKKFSTSRHNTDLNFRGKDAFKGCIHVFKTTEKKYSWEEYYREELLDFFGSYFRVCYQIVKLIDQNQALKELGIIENEEYSIKQKEYFDIFRATLTQHELETFFFNCLYKYGNGKFKKLIEKFGMFEPLLMDFNYPTEKFNRLSKFAYQYHTKAFEKNSNWINYFHEVNRIDLNCDVNLVEQHTEMLKNFNFHIGYYDDKFQILTFEEINKSISNYITKYSEKFIDTENLSTLSEENIKIYNKLQALKKINLTHEVYMCLKYGINIKDYIEYKKLST